MNTAHVKSRYELPRIPFRRRAMVGAAWALAWTLVWGSALLMFSVRTHAGSSSLGEIDGPTANRIDSLGVARGGFKR
jgi:hypothetical protein